MIWPFRHKPTEAEFLELVVRTVTYDQHKLELEPPPKSELREVSRTLRLIEETKRRSTIGR